jgi:hypothetical protein
MPSHWHNLSLPLAFALIALSGSACGGRSEDGEGHAGNGGSAGSSSGLGGNTAQAGSSAFGGSGAFGGNSAQGGQPQSGGQASTGGQAGSGNECIDFNDVYVRALEDARRCDPALSVDQCTLSFSGGLNCSCPTFVNPANSGALDEAKKAMALYVQQGCGRDILCGACRAPTRAFCSVEGRCQDVYGRSCKVAGTVYPNGASGIKNPASPCNTCTCDDGMLSCTEIGCGVGCPDGTAFGSQCAECGPTDNCLTLEYDCFPTCTEACPSPQQLCFDGICKSGFFCG